ncbi:MAG: hypothetical protein BWY82_00828 [Verrucomicrobia bacterium ADurb.Bin474]|nr:MAG: hypothetical protein BWY82_00828 [Verrucomicrobia bacterium ADurb.Bin474]
MNVNRKILNRASIGFEHACPQHADRPELRDFQEVGASHSHPKTHGARDDFHRNPSLVELADIFDGFSEKVGGLLRGTRSRIVEDIGIHEHGPHRRGLGLRCPGGRGQFIKSLGQRNRKGSIPHPVPDGIATDISLHLTQLNALLRAISSEHRVNRLAARTGLAEDRNRIEDDAIQGLLEVFKGGQRNPARTDFGRSGGVRIKPLAGCGIQQDIELVRLAFQVEQRCTVEFFRKALRKLL